MTLQRKTILAVSIISVFLAITKILAGIFSGSIALIASGIDSILDVIISFINYFALTKSEKPPTKKFNYGYGKSEVIAAFFEGIIIVGSGFYILYESFNKIINKESIQIDRLAPTIYITLFCLIITTILVFVLSSVAKKTNNLVLKTDSLHYKMDVVTNFAVLASLCIIYLTDIHIFDSLVGIVFSIYIIYSAYKIIRDSITLLLDVALDVEDENKIIKILRNQKNLSDYHNLKTRKTPRENFVDVHLVFNENISLLKAHSINDLIIDKIKNINSKKEWRITTHLDPIDDS